MNHSNCILELHRIGAIKFGQFTLKSGILSPIYIDLRLIVSYPVFLKQIGEALYQLIKHLKFDCIVGVPYTALPIATVISVAHDIPMLMRRKEAKGYGTKKIIEGVFEPNQNCLVVEDLITSGSSIFETIEPLEEEGLKVTDIVVILDREQGGKRRIEEKGYHLHSLFSMYDLLSVFEENGKIDATIAEEVKHFIKTHTC